MSINYLSSFLLLVLNSYLVHGQQACRTYPTNVEGECIPLNDCPRLQGLLTKSRVGDVDAVNILRRSVCSLRPPTLCCELPTPPYDPTPTECGKGKLADFIVGGQDAGWWPWMVLLLGRSVHGGRLFHFCGGTLINDRFVLTAAHCNDPRVNLESVRAGELIISTNPDTYKRTTAPPVQENPSAQFINHPEYKQGCRTCNDIALIRLARPVTIDKGFVSPVCLPLPENNFSFSGAVRPGTEATATGWGTSNLDGPPILGQPDHLQEVVLHIDTTFACQRATRNHPFDSTLCAGLGDGKDTCKGDSGGPLMVANSLGTRHFLIGITSFGPKECGSAGTQGIYTNVHHYLPWILETIRN